MSTEQQQYSIDNQFEAIRAYAIQHNMTIVRTYTNAGKTGLTDQRPGLKQLIEDVECGSAGYSAVLVYDVSRWGRFQDADQSAYYEYRCRRAKIAIHYCAETFPNDGSITTTLLKALKRAMAAEYSRDLSVKVFAGKARLTELGFHQGGLAGYGIRRLLVDQNGNAKFLLKPGEEKSIATDRVVLLAGPEEEREVVREIFRMYASNRHSPNDIARILNDRGVRFLDGRPWTRHIIRNIVTNPKYVGTNICNRRSGKLRSRTTRNAPEMWIKKENAFEAIISEELYEKAGGVAAFRSRRFSDDKLLDYLRELLRRKGRLTARLVAADKDMPSPQLYLERFGGLLEAYQKIGYTPTRNLIHLERDRAMTIVRRQFTVKIIDEFDRLGVPVFEHNQTHLIYLNNRLSLRLSVMRFCQLRSRFEGWQLRLRSPSDPDVTVIARMKPGNGEILDYFYLPRKAIRGKVQLSIRAGESSKLDPYRFEDLAFLSELASSSREKRKLGTRRG